MSHEKILENIRDDNTELWKEDLKNIVPQKFSKTGNENRTHRQLTGDDMKDINDLIKQVDKILSLNNKDDNNDNKLLNIKVKKLKQKFSSIDIFKFRLANVNCMRTIVLFCGLNDITPNPVDNIITYERAGQRTFNAVFTINDLFYSRNKGHEFFNGNWLTLDKFQEWFTKPWNRLPQFNLNNLVQNSYRQLPQQGPNRNIVRFMRALPDNLMINVFILFIAFSDRIATLSMYTSPGAEPEYYYKSDSQDMGEVLRLFNQYKSPILIKLEELLHQLSLEAGAGPAPGPIDILNDLAQQLNTEGNVGASMIISSMLQAYKQVYYNKQITNLSNGPDNEFFQDYQVKFTMFTTMVVTFVKDGLKHFNKEKIASKSSKSVANTKSAKVKQQNKITLQKQTNLKKSAIVEKRRITLAKNKQAAQEALRVQTAQVQARAAAQAANRDARSNKRKREGGSTKVVIYLVKIEKIRELNKKLRKNKNKNKTKIEKNNKLIDELKIKLKKQKEKEKKEKQKKK